MPAQVCLLNVVCAFMLANLSICIHKIDCKIYLYFLTNSIAISHVTTIKSRYKFAPTLYMLANIILGNACAKKMQTAYCRFCYRIIYCARLLITELIKYIQRITTKLISYSSLNTSICIISNLYCRIYHGH